jgi:hypothetical protein
MTLKTGMKTLVQKNLKTPLWRDKRTCTDIIKMNLKEMGCRLNSSGSQHGDVAVISLEGSRRAKNFQASWATIRSSRTQLRGVSLFQCKTSRYYLLNFTEVSLPFSLLLGLNKLAAWLALPSCLAYSSTMKMEATCSSDTSVDFRRNIQHYRTLQRF